MLTIKRILREIGDSNIDLYKADDYFVMQYDDGVAVFETVSVYVPHVNDLDINQWKAYARDLFDKITRLAEE